MIVVGLQSWELSFILKLAGMSKLCSLCPGPGGILFLEGGSWAICGPRFTDQAAGHEEQQQRNQELGVGGNNQALLEWSRRLWSSAGCGNVQQLFRHNAQTKSAGAAAPQQRFSTTLQSFTSRGQPGARGGSVHAQQHCTVVCDCTVS